MQGKLTIDVDRCKGCENCVRACPKGVLALDPVETNRKGYHPVRAMHPEDCIACTSCALMCPDSVITVEEM